MREDTDRPESDLDQFSNPPAVPEGGVGGESPWVLATRRLRKRRFALLMGCVFLLLVIMMLAAPLWADHVAHTTPYENHLSEKIDVGGVEKDVVSLDGVPIGPTWHGQFLLGADGNGRDVAVRLLYGGRNSLMIGLFAALVTTILGLITGLVSGYFRGITDSVLSRIMDVLWAFPVILLGIALGTSLALGGLKVGPLEVKGGSLAIPIFVIAIIYVPYLARPIRGEVLSLREQEFVEAARAQGMGSFRLIVSEILPNVASTGLVFFPLLVANAILLEASLSFLGAGVQPPEPSWGTMIEEGVQRIVTAPALAIVPGLMIVITVLSLNVFGEAVRDALDPKAKVRIEH